MYYVQDANKTVNPLRTSPILEEDLQALGGSERNVLRTIFGGIQENSVGRQNMKHEIVALYGEPTSRKFPYLEGYGDYVHNKPG